MPASDDTVLYTGGVVYPFDGGRADPAEALLVRGGRAVAYGAESALAGAAGGPVRKIRLDGATVLPGLIDTHPHLLHYGSLQEPLVPLWDATSHADIVSRIAERAHRTPPGEWIMATPVGEPHYFIRRSYRDLAEGELPDRRVLDRATTKHPVVIQSWAPSLPNTLAFNGMALEKLGIDRSTPDRVDRVWIDKDQAGEPTGLLRGSVTNYYSYDDFSHSLWRRIPFLRYENLVPGTKTAMRAYNGLGVTAVYENHMMDRPLVDGYRELRRRGELTLRVLTSQEAEAYGMPWSRPREAADFRRRLDRAAAEVELTDDLLRFGGVSLMWDGTGAIGGVMMCHPYPGPYGEPTEGFHNISPDKAEQVIRFCARRRIRLAIACMGLKAHEECLPVLEAADAEYGVRSLGWVLVHALFITEEQVRRYRDLRMDVTTSMSFVWGEGHLYAERMGQKALADLAPLRRFFDAGCHVAGGSDWGPKNAFEHIQLALTHEFGGSGHRNLGPAQRISRAEAVRMWTWDAGRVLRWDDIGHLAAGAHADLVVVDRDPMTCDAEDIGKTRVLRTVFGGSVVHDTGELS